MTKPLPLAGVRVVEFTHMVMGPTCGMILGDLGAEVIKIEPLAGDNTRRLLVRAPASTRSSTATSAASRSTRRIRAGWKWCSSSSHGRRVQRELQGRHDGRAGPRTGAPAALNPGLVHVSHKGFLPGPYEHRTALDEVVQMMGGLAYMTGRAGDPLRAGSSVNDIMGGMFGAIGALAALLQRDRANTGTGTGRKCRRRCSRTTSSSSPST